MFTKILIANRGEIAVRIMATCREMGIQTVAIYSSADVRALHVREADEAYEIGPAPANESYLCIDKIIAVAQQCGAQAIHPGYGFLSENPAFVEACQKAQLVFIGPNADTMRLMGSKIAAKRLAQEVMVPIVPGYSGDQQDASVLLTEANTIGYPLLIKASAGGGGKGMRTVRSADDFLSQLEGAKREALAAFGDDTVFLERLIERPRHIEIQILGDHYGHLIHLGERECSIQRRHQKIIEESPSVALTPELRTEMGAAALRLAQAAHYTNAGTLEFMLDKDGQFYFLEMNTRLQVEHPVTELVTGLDLVRHQIEIAADGPLTITQEHITQRGHAIEVRLYAEDPLQDFLPSPGVITSLIKPEGPGLRLDSGVESGDEISPFYDPMIAKLIVYGEDRLTAIERLKAALTRFCLLGVTTNLALLQAISVHPAFRDGQIHTHFLEDEGLLKALMEQTQQPIPDAVLIAAALYDLHNSQYRLRQSYNQSRDYTAQKTVPNPWKSLGPWHLPEHQWQTTYTNDEQAYTITVRPVRDKTETWYISPNAAPALEVTGTIINGTVVRYNWKNQSYRAYVQDQPGKIQVMLAAQSYYLSKKQPPAIKQTANTTDIIQGKKTLTAPMAGTIIKILVQKGETVKAHQPVVILGAMKMEHAITAPVAGEIRQLHYQEGAVVPGGAVIAEIA